MTEFFNVGNRKLIPLRDVSKFVPYSKDYVARLARDGKIAAAQINRQWYIDPVSLKNFFDHAQLELQARAEYTRALRKEELDLHDWWESFVAAQSDKRATRSHRAVNKTIIVIILGLFVGFLVSSFAPFTNPAVIAGLVSGTEQQAALVDTVIPDMDWYEYGEIISETEEIPLNNGIVLFPVLPTDASSTDPASFFSDPVEVRTTGTTTGELVSPNGIVIPFVRVPVGASANDSP